MRLIIINKLNFSKFISLMLPIKKSYDGKRSLWYPKTQLFRKSISWDDQILKPDQIVLVQDGCLGNDLIEIITEKENFYNVKSIIEEKVKNIYSSGIEWVPKNTVDLSVEQSKKVIEILEMLEENEDVQNTFANCKFNEN